MSAVPVVWESESQPEPTADHGTLLLPAAFFPLIFRPSRRFTEEEFLLFCAANEVLHIEQTAEGESIVMTPAGNRTGLR
jgi:hypothetical protein